MKTQPKSIFNILLFAAMLTSLCGTVLKVTPVEAASPIVVTTTTDEYSDPGPGAGCSLREAVTAANTDTSFGGCTATFGTNAINLGSHPYELTRTGVSEDANVTGDLDISAPLTIQGAGAANTIIEAGTDGTNGIDRVLSINGAYAVDLHDLTIAFGKCPSGCSGGGIWNGGTLTINNSALTDNSAASDLGGGIENTGTLNIGTSTFSGNSAASGGGIMNDSGTLTVVNSTFSDNSSSGDGGGLYNTSGVTATVINSTFSGNSAPSGYGGGILNFGTGTLNLENTILANSVSFDSDDCFNNGGTIGTDVKNLIETNPGSGHNCGTPAVTSDPVLSTLGSHGAVTENFALLDGSPAINAGDDTVCDADPVFDGAQNGGLRPQGAHCDIGSYEVAASEGVPTFTVNKTADTYDGFCDTLGNGLVNKDCSLRDAITAANQNPGTDTITVPNLGGTYTLSIGGTGEDMNATGDLDIRSNMNINGDEADGTIINASGIDRAFHITGAYTVNISGVTIYNGHVDSPANGGGILNQGGILTVSGSYLIGNYAGTGANGAGIQNTSGGTLAINNSTFSSNVASGGSGGGVNNDNGTLTVTNSTFSGNTATKGGGLNNNSGTATVRNSTFSGNHLGVAGGGISNNATLNMANTILANTTGGDGSDCYMETGAILGTNVKNLIETNSAISNNCGTAAVTADPNLNSTIELNGGTTRSFALLAGSPALYVGDNATCAAAPVSNTSQNGVTRPQGIKCDIGSYEMTVTKTTVNVKSTGVQDGWVLESSETSNQGGSFDSTSTTFRLGDDASKKQYRGILSFATGVSIPDNAVVSNISLKLKKQGVKGGGNPVTAFQGFMLDIKKGFFGTTLLEKTDFQKASTHSYGPFSTVLAGGFYTIDLSSGAGDVNTLATNSGLTQVRVRFKKDDDNNATANYLSLYSGNVAASAPVLSIQYYIP